MERANRSKLDAPSLVIWSLLFVASQNLVVIPVMSNAIVGDQKNFFYYYPPTDPRSHSPPTGVILSPPSGGSTPSHRSPPSHNGGSGSTPSYGTPTTPSHGSGSGSHHGHRGTPPANCGNPPSKHHNPTLAPPTSGGGGGYHHSPPTSGGGSPPKVTPPTITPGTPPYDPHTPPFGGTCDFWRNHPTLIWGLFRWWGTTLGTAFGIPASIPTVPGFTGSHLTLQEALTNTRTDGLGALYREGTAALLNSMVNNKFSFTTSQVRDSFVNSIGSNKAAAAQAGVFKRANEALAKSKP